MFARVVAANARPGTAEIGARMFEEHMLSVIGDIAGYRASYLLWDDQTDEALAIALYDSREELEADPAGQQARVGAFSEILAGPPTMRVYEVRAHRSR